MAKESMKARERKRAKIVAKYAEKRKALKEAGDYDALQKLPKNASPVRMHNRCKITGRPKGYMRQFGLSRVTFREMANQGLIIIRSKIILNSITKIKKKIHKEHLTSKRYINTKNIKLKIYPIMLIIII